MLLRNEIFQNSLESDVTDMRNEEQISTNSSEKEDMAYYYSSDEENDPDIGLFDSDLRSDLRKRAIV